MRAVSCRDDFLLQIRLHLCPRMCQLSRYPSMWKALAMERQAREPTAIGRWEIRPQKQQHMKIRSQKSDSWIETLENMQFFVYLIQFVYAKINN